MEDHFLNPRAEDKATLRGACKKSLTYMLDSPNQGFENVVWFIEHIWFGNKCQ